MKLILTIDVDEPKLQAKVNTLYDPHEDIPTAEQVVTEWAEELQNQFDAGDDPDLIWLVKGRGLTLTHHIEH
jgi:hypothetical protein